ncbi:MAG: ribosome recycling factor [Pseudomonadota bacterium]|nr:ribosome recycling factor [Gammaproteobacteria bacterium]MBU1558634.1 ribosome recycling factor [Gammaproteobacteria bacterium]MBU1926678.1 ribosome recycling factor [Gammaproteobacteria bacterium]MBU2546521.1 ribosome recycling factor [Gammaproteobacteria bacterium]
MFEELKKNAEAHMQKSIEALRSELAKVRTGRAHVGLIEHLQVSYYGNSVPLNQVASITVGDARTLVVSPWEKNMVPVIEKAILQSDIGLNPATSGQLIRVPVPPLTEERRKELVKLIRASAENSRIAIRNARRDANNSIKELLKTKKINEDEERRDQEVIQKLTDQYIADVEKLLSTKEADLTSI